MPEYKINIEDLSIEQAQELFDMVAINLSEIEEELSKAKSQDKVWWLRSLINYQVLYNKIEKALGEHANDSTRPDIG